MTPASPSRVDFPEGSRGLNLLQVFVVFALVLGGVLLALRKLDELSGSVDEVDRLYRDAVSAAGSGAPVARAADGLPPLSDAARERLAALGAPVVLRDKQILAEQVLTGVCVVEPGARVVLRDVTLDGVIVSRAALDGGARGPSWVICEGEVRLDAGRTLPGLAVMLPGGSLLASDPDSDVRVRGDVVAERVELAGAGELLGALHLRHAPVLADDVRTGRLPPVELAPDAAPAAFDPSPLTSFEFP